jgi:hypothetical protein
MVLPNSICRVAHSLAQLQGKQQSLKPAYVSWVAAMRSGYKAVYNSQYCNPALNPKFCKRQLWFCCDVTSPEKDNFPGSKAL